MKIPVIYQNIGLGLIYLALKWNGDIASFAGSSLGTIILSVILIKIVLKLSRKKLDEVSTIRLILVASILITLIMAFNR